jgi:hypothetical protein
MPDSMNMIIWTLFLPTNTIIKEAAEIASTDMMNLCTVKMGRTLTYGLHSMKSSIDAVP